jgi:hypothetical protein
MSDVSASWGTAVVTFVEKQYLPIALLSALALGAANPAPGLAAAKMHIPALATFGIFIVQVGAACAAQQSKGQLSCLMG